MTLLPDRKFDTYRDLTPQFLSEQGIDALLIDIDNTLAPYEQPDHDEHHAEWFRSMRESGVSCVLISNNHADRVSRFVGDMEIPAYPDCHKPSLRVLRRVVAEQGIDPTCAAVLGDQIYTDCLSARRLGMRAFIVPPIRDKKTLFFRFKRLLEVPIMKKYDRIHRSK